VRRPLLVFAAAVAAVTAVPLAGQSAGAIVSARSTGLIGERYDGYLGYVAAPPGGLRAQVEAVNIRRRALYSNLAARRGVSPRDVGVTAGCRMLATVAVGEYYLLADTGGRRRRAGQPVPVPDYCTP